MDDIPQALARVRERIAEAALRSGRRPSDVSLVAVSKTFPAEAVAQAFEAGQRDFGENRPEEALPKMEAVADRLAALGAGPAALQWHLIGHVQSRKARDAAGRFSLVHSVDTAKLAQALARHVPPAESSAAPAGQPQSILLECNVSGEAAKDGFRVAGWERDAAVFDAFAAEVARIVALPQVRVRGLMTLAPIVEQPEQARPFFASLRGLRDALRRSFPAVDWQHLSMGMTDDFEAAIAEGATLVRIGRAIFGVRPG